MAFYFNITAIIFLIFMIITNFLATLVNYFKKYLPACMNKAVLYGNLANTGSEVKCLRFIEIPKSYFSHFYFFGAIFSSSSLCYMVSVYFFNVDVNKYVKLGLNTLIEEKEPVTVTTALTTMVLFTIQCSRRLYESLFMQVFAKSSKMNIVHYMMAVIHYGLCIISIVGHAPLFCGNQIRNNMTSIDINTEIAIAPSILLFLYASYEQHHSHKILANLRKNKETGSVVTDDYQIPQGGLFRWTSSPHRLCEVLIYLALALLMQKKTHTVIFLWVATNQTQCSIGAQQWYKKTFKDYPPERYAIFPFLV